MLIQIPSYNPGLFSIFSSVVGLLYEYENKSHEYKGIGVDFGDKGLYYDKNLGPNYWQYYCEPINVGNKDTNNILIATDDDHIKKSTYLTHNLSREQINALFHRHVKIRKSITDQVDTFVNEKFKGSRVVGVHYRGTDKITEAPRTEYDRIGKIIKEKINLLKDDNYKIFVATDETGFLDYMYEAFPNRIVCKDCKRSDGTQPLHIANPDPANKGKKQ